MYTDHEIDQTEHLNWIKNLKNDKNKLVFAIFKKKDIPIGVISLDSLDKKNKKGNWSFYLDESSRAGLGAFLEYEFLNFVFDDLKLEKLNCEVLENNSAVIKMHKKFQFKDEGFKRSYIQKDANRLGVYLLGITRKEWKEKRLDIYKKFNFILNKFTIQIEEDTKAADDVLSLIEQTRSKNNVNWMALLRLCVEKDPEIAKPIIKQIMSLDREISNLTAKLIEE